jgi:hypothetical protein
MLRNYRKNRSPAPPNVQSPGSKFCTEIRGGGAGKWSSAVLVILVENGYSQSIPRRRKHKKQYYNSTCYVDYN